MSAELQLFLALVVAHLTGDFLLQRTAVVEARKNGSWWAYAEHGGWHLAALILVLAMFAPGVISRPSAFAVLVGLVIAHLAVDWSKSRPGQILRPWFGFVADQAAHALVLALAWAMIIGPPAASDVVAAAWHGAGPQLLVLMAAYLLALPSAGYLNASLLEPLAVKAGQCDDGENSDESLANAGKLIGWLERFLILTAVLVRSPTGVGFVLAAKSVFRFEDARHGRRAAEYFLIGTLLSVSEAVLVGLGALLLGR